MTMLKKAIALLLVFAMLSGFAVTTFAITLEEIEYYSGLPDGIEAIKNGDLIGGIKLIADFAVKYIKHIFVFIFIDHFEPLRQIDWGI